MPTRLVPAVRLLLAAGLALGPSTAAVAQPASGAARTDALPLEPARRLRFTTAEGTWMSLDVSPDGRTIVFDLLGDLYTLPIAGGTATRLTSGMAFDAQPRWSPDGRSIAFVSDRSGADNVWIVDADGGNARAITRDERTSFISPEWTPDGEFVVVSKSTEVATDYQLVMYHRSGVGSGVSITGRAAVGAGVVDSGAPRPRSVLGIAFGGDPRYAWTSMAVGRGYGQWQLALLDRASGRLFKRTEEGASALRPVPSPDGRWLVYGTRRDGVTALKLVELASGDERWLVPAVDRDDQEGRHTRDLMPGASFTPDGTALVASYRGKLWRITVPDGRATPIPFTADVDLGLGALARFEYPVSDSAVVARRIEQPRRSPDGRALAFSALGRLWVQSLTSSTPPRRLSEGSDGAFYPAWSPDGRWIAYVTWNDLEGGDVWRVRGDGSARPERLTRQRAFYEKLAWAPDGRRLVAARGPRQQRITFFDEAHTGRPQSLEFVSIPASCPVGRRAASEGCVDATTITPVNTATRFVSQHYGLPHFTADTTRLWFTDPVDGLVSVRWDGSDRRSHLRVNGYEWTRTPPGLADEILVSPTGTHVLALVNNQVWLVDVPPTGERLPTLFLPSPTPALPAKRLTTVGADFIEWGTDGRTVHWALGSSYWSYDLATGTTATPREVTVRVPRDTPRGSVALRGARVITMKGNEVIENADVVVTDDRIAAVGPRGSVAIPSGAREIDVAGKTILPGYVDVHAHMWAPWGVHRTQVWEYLANLAYGVTTTRDPQTMTADVLTYADEVAAGDVLGPRIFTTARGVFSSEDLRSLDDARNVARRYAEFYHTETLKSYHVGDRRHRQWLVMAARERQLTLTAEGTTDFKLYLTMVLDGFGGVEHAFSLANIYGDIVRLMAESGTTHTPTLIVSAAGLAGENLWYRDVDVHGDPKLGRFTPHEELDNLTLRRTVLAHPNQFAVTDLAREANQILAAGGRVALGAHGQLQGLGAHWELWMLQSGGMSTHDALRAATLLGAEAIGHGKDIGSIEVGKRADLQVLDDNPLDDIRHSTSIRYVMVNGRLYAAGSLDEVWPRQRGLPHQWWQEPARDER